MKLLKLIKSIWLHWKWYRTDEYKLFELLLELRTEVLNNKFNKFSSNNGICVNVLSCIDYKKSTTDTINTLCTKFVEEYPHKPDVWVDNKYLPHYYPVEGNPKAFFESLRLNQLWFNPRRLQLLDYMIMELYKTKPEL